MHVCDWIVSNFVSSLSILSRIRSIEWERSFFVTYPVGRSIANLVKRVVMSSFFLHNSSMLWYTLFKTHPPKKAIIANATSIN